MLTLPAMTGVGFRSYPVQGLQIVLRHVLTCRGVDMLGLSRTCLELGGLIQLRELNVG